MPYVRHKQKVLGISFLYLPFWLIPKIHLGLLLFLASTQNIHIVFYAINKNGTCTGNCLHSTCSMIKIEFVFVLFFSLSKGNNSGNIHPKLYVIILMSIFTPLSSKCQSSVYSIGSLRYPWYLV